MKEFNNTKYRKRRNARRRRRRGAYIVFTVVSFIIILAAVFTAITVFFKIENIKVTGKTRYSEAQVIEASAIDVGDNLFMINKFSSIEKIFNKLPYAQSIIIKRHLPDSIEITVTDTKPVALVKSGDLYYLIDINGKILEGVKTPSNDQKNLALITGISLLNPKAGQKMSLQDEDKRAPLFDILNVTEVNGILDNINKLNLEKLYDIYFTYDGRLDVVLGTTDELTKKTRFLLSILERLSPSDKGIVDLTDTTTARFRPDVSKG